MHRVSGVRERRACGPKHSSIRLASAKSRRHLVDVLSYGDLRRLEIARALATRPKLLLLDEPFAGLGAAEIQPLADLIRVLHRSEGLTILIIEHKLREFMQLVHEVIAMDFGEVVAIGTPAVIVRNPRVVEAYIGKVEFDAPAGNNGRWRWRCLRSRIWSFTTARHWPWNGSRFPSSGVS